MIEKNTIISFNALHLAVCMATDEDMNADRFRSNARGTVMTCAEGYPAFIPAPLPRTLPLTEDTVKLLSEADATLGELTGICRRLPDSRFLTRTHLQREAVLSSRIEGTQAQLSDILQDELEESDSDRSPSDLRKVKNYIAALELGIDLCPSMPIDLLMVRQLHGRLYEGFKETDPKPGQFRLTQNWIGPKGCSGRDAAFVPPPVHHMRAALADWERFLSESDRLPDLITCALMHQHFETIHPFIDGNGRVGRLLITLFLMKRKRLPRPFLYLSSFFEAHQEEYYDLLQKVRTHGEWDEWLDFFLCGVIEVSEQTILLVDRLLQLRDECREKFRDKPNAVTLVEQLLINPFITVPKAEEVLGVTAPTARQVIKHLENTGFLEELTGRLWRRAYFARPVLDIIEGVTVQPSAPKRMRRNSAKVIQAVADVAPKRDQILPPAGGKNDQKEQDNFRRRFLSIKAVLGNRDERMLEEEHSKSLAHRWEQVSSDVRQKYLTKSRDAILSEGITDPAEDWVERRAYVLWSRKEIE